MEKKLHKSKLSKWYLLIAQDLWQAHYQILLNILLKESMEVDVHMDMIIKHLKNAALNTKIASAMLST